MKSNLELDSVSVGLVHAISQIASALKSPKYPANLQLIVRVSSPPSRSSGTNVANRITYKLVLLLWQLAYRLTLVGIGLNKTDIRESRS